MNIKLRLATSQGFREIAPASLNRYGFADKCQLASYVDGPADSDPYYHCDLYDQRTDGKRLPQCINATNPVVVEAMRLKAEAYDGYRIVEVPFPQEHLRNLLVEVRRPLVYHTLRFARTRCVCNEHGTFFAALLPDEEPKCPRCIEVWLKAIRAVLFRILIHALAHLHRARMDAEHGALRVGRLPDSMLYPGAEWIALGENPSWNPLVADGCRP